MINLPPNVVKLFDNLAGKLDQATPQIWSTLIKQVYVTGIQDIIGSVTCGVILWVLLRVMRNAKMVFDEQHFDWYSEPICVFGVIFTIAVAIAGFILLINAIGYFINPSYYAIKLLLD